MLYAEKFFGKLSRLRCLSLSKYLVRTRLDKYIYRLYKETRILVLQEVIQVDNRKRPDLSGFYKIWRVSDSDSWLKTAGNQVTDKIKSYIFILSFHPLGSAKRIDHTASSHIRLFVVFRQM